MSTIYEHQIFWILIQEIRRGHYLLKCASQILRKLDYKKLAGSNVWTYKPSYSPTPHSSLLFEMSLTIIFINIL